MDPQLSTRRRLRPQGVRITWTPRPRPRTGALGPLPPLKARGGAATPEQFKVFTEPRASPPVVAMRVLAWLMAALRFGLGVLGDRLRGRLTEARTAARLRGVLEAMGPTAIKAGQRVAMRLDLLPLAYAAELSKIRDTAPPMALSHAIDRVEAATRRPMSRVFKSFDPTPISSDSIACTYQAVLITDAKVAVRVRRPDAPAVFAAERAAVGWLIRRVATWLPVWRNLLNELERELPRLLLHDLDFIRAARLQRLFRKEARDGGLDFLTAAKVYIKLCSEEVLVSEFVSGVWLDEVIAAREIDLRVMDIDPVQCGKRLLHAAWWGFFECSFFCEVPASGRIVVRENGQLVFVSLGDTGLLGTRQRKLFYTALERLGLYDLEGGVQMLVQLLMPLPYLSVYDFTKQLSSRLWGPLVAMNNPDSAAWERASTGLWLSLFETTREHGVTVGLDLSRLMQSAILYEHMATRLWPRINLFREFADYKRNAVRRRNDRARPRGQRAVSPIETMRELRGRMMSGLPDLVGQAALWSQTLVDNAPVRHLSHTHKGAYAVLQAVHAIALMARLALLAAGVHMGWTFWRTRTFDLETSALTVINHPAVNVAVVFIMLVAARRVLFRLEDVSEDERKKS